MVETEPIEHLSGLREFETVECLHESSFVFEMREYLAVAEKPTKAEGAHTRALRAERDGRTVGG